MAGPLGSTPGIIVGVGVGAAASAALAPAIEIPKQEAWANNANRILDVGLLARLVAQGGRLLPDAYPDANRDGYGNDKLDALVYLEQTVPGLAQALELWRRFALPDDLWTHALIKAGLDARYLPFLNMLKTGELVGMGDIAYGVVRGILPAPAWVPVAPPATGDYVPRFAQVALDPEVLAAKLGFDLDQLKLMVGRSGLSMAPIMAATASFRTEAKTRIDAAPPIPGISSLSLTNTVGPNDYLLAIAEGDLRTEWAEAVRETARQILTAHDYAELQLRGFLTAEQRRALTALHGMSDGNSDLLYDVLGRAPAVHAVTTGLARGGTLNGDTSAIPTVYLESMERSNLRPEWYSIAYANRYSYPSAFVLRTLAQAGELGDATAVEQILLEIGWPPTLAAEVAAKWVPTGTALDPNVKKAHTKAWTEAQASYIAEESTAADVQPILTLIGVPATATADVLAAWDAIRALIRKQLSPAQIKKAVKEAVPNPATGAPWSTADGLAALLARGYSQADATTLLEE